MYIPTHAHFLKKINNSKFNVRHTTKSRLYLIRFLATQICYTLYTADRIITVLSV